jgi:putative SOS response-associated peptidase YedK
MCSHYEAVKKPERLKREFGAEPPPETVKLDMWPGYLGNFIRSHPNADVGDDAVPAVEALNGVFGLVPHWSQDTKITRSTYNARSETVAEKPSFRDAWKRGQRCIIAADAIYEPDWRSGRAVNTRIKRADGMAMGIAGLWASWKSPKGDYLHSFTMLTINANEHGLMRQFHKPTDEKRMVVILPESRYAQWLGAWVGGEREFLVPYPAELLVAGTPTAPRCSSSDSDPKRSHCNTDLSQPMSG